MENQVMTPDQALTFLDTCCASVSMGRPAHVQGIQAVQVLKQLISNGNGASPQPVHDGLPKEEDNSAKETETEN